MHMVLMAAGAVLWWLSLRATVDMLSQLFEE